MLQVTESTVWAMSVTGTASLNNLAIAGMATELPNF